MPRHNKRATNDQAVLTTHSIMTGTRCPVGPGGRDCVCCGDAPGKDRVHARRTAKRRERQRMQRIVRNSEW